MLFLDFFFVKLKNYSTYMNHGFKRINFYLYISNELVRKQLSAKFQLVKMYFLIIKEFLRIRYSSDTLKNKVGQNKSNVSLRARPFLYIHLVTTSFRVSSLTFGTCSINIVNFRENPDYTDIINPSVIRETSSIFEYDRKFFRICSIDTVFVKKSLLITELLSITISISLWNLRKTLSIFVYLREYLKFTRLTAFAVGKHYLMF